MSGRNVSPDAIRHAIDRLAESPTLDNARHCLATLVHQSRRSTVTSEDVKAVADAVHSSSLLDALPTAELARMCELIAETNSAELPLFIAGGPVVSFSRRQDASVDDVVRLAYGHLVSIRPSSPPAQSVSAILATVPADKENIDSALTSLLAVALYIADADHEGGLPFSAYLVDVATESVENLRTQMNSLDSSFTDHEEAFWSCTLDVCTTLLERPDAPHNAPFYLQWIGYQYERLADARDETTYESTDRLAALDAFMECVDHPEFSTLCAHQINYVTLRLVRLSIGLARSSPKTFYRECAFIGFYAAMKYETQDCAQLELELAQELRHIPFPVHAEVEKGAIRGVGSGSVLDGLADLTMVIPDTALSDNTFHVSAYLSGDVDESIVDVSVQADHPTVVIEGDAGNIRRKGSLFTATLLASHGDYVGQIYVTVLKDNQPADLITRTVLFRSPGSGVTQHLSMSAVGRLESAQADLHLVALRDRGNFIVDILEGPDANAKRTAVIEVETEPATFVAHALGEIRTSWAKALDPSGRFRDENRYLLRTLDSLADTLSDSLLQEGLSEALPRAAANHATIVIATNEPSIPWEILPISKGPTRSFLSADCAVCIMPYVGTIPSEFSLTKINAYVRSSASGSSWMQSPQFADELSEVFSSRDRSRFSVKEFELSRDSLLPEWNSATGDLWYIASHGIFDEDGRRLLIETDDEYNGSPPGRLDGIRLSDLCAGPAPVGAFLFVNGCNTAIEEFGLFRRQSWPQRLLERGIAGFLGTRWPVTDRSATLFARTFFEELEHEKTIPECVRLARAAVRQAYGEYDISWAAYTLYCHPQLRASISK